MNVKLERPIPIHSLDENQQLEMGKLFSEIWYEGWHHEMAILTASWLACSAVALGSAKGVIRIASDTVKGDTPKRLADVESVYDYYVTGMPVKGRPAIEQMINEVFPDLVRDKARSVLSQIGKLLPKDRRVAREFRITHLKKILSIPPLWVVTLEIAGKTVVTTSKNSRFANFRRFSEDVLAQNSVIPVSTLGEYEWRIMINEAINAGLLEEVSELV